MRDIVIIQKFNELDENIGRVASYSIGCEARIRVWEKMATRRGGMLLLMLRNIFAPEGLKAEVVERFKQASKYEPEKPQDNIEVVKVHNDEELKAELAKAGAGEQ